MGRDLRRQGANTVHQLKSHLAVGEAAGVEVRPNLSLPAEGRTACGRVDRGPPLTGLAAGGQLSVTTYLGDRELERFKI